MDTPSLYRRSIADSHQSSPTEQPAVARLLGILRRRGRLIALITMLGTALAAFVASQRSPLYTAEAEVMIELREKRVLEFQQVLTGLPADIMAVRSEIGVITSRANLNRVIDQLQLATDPRFTAGGGSQSALFAWVPDARRAIAEWFAGLWPGGNDQVGLLSAADADEVDGPVLSQLRRNLAVTNDGRTYVINIRFTGYDPELTAAIANGVADQYIASQVQEKRAQTARAAQWLSERLVKLGSEAEQADSAVRNYRVIKNLPGDGRTDAVNQSFSELQAELSRAEADLANKEARLQFLRDVRQKKIPLESATEVLGSPIIVDLRRQESVLAREEAQLATEHGPLHPRLRQVVSERQQIAAKVDNEAARLAANVENEHKIASRRVAQLRSAVDTARAKSGAAEVAKVQLDQLLREAEASREIYTSVLKRLNETREQEALVEPDARVVSRASVPMLPSSPGIVLIAILGFLTSTLIGTVVALLLERLDQGLRSEDDVRSALALPRLSLVPRVRRRGGIPVHEHLLEMPFSSYAESIRLTLTALRSLPKPRQAELLMVTSSVPDEGKTTLATSLAVAAASAGYRTMLMDCDFRHPSVLKVLGLPDRPGIVDHVTRHVPLADIVIDGPVDRLKVMAAGRLTIDPMPLLTGDMFRALLASIRSEYEHVIIDTSPVLGISDAQNLARSVDKIVLVVQWNKTPRSIARSTAQILGKLDTPIAGVVMTQVDVGRHAQYDYGDVGDVLHKYRKYYSG